MSKRSTPASTPKSELKVASVTAKVTKSPNEALALTNNIFLHPDDAKAIELPKEMSGALPVTNYVKIKNFIFNFQGNPAIPKGYIGFSATQRRTCELALNDDLVLKPYKSKKTNVFLLAVKLEVDYLQKGKKDDTFEGEYLDEVVKKTLVNQFLTIGQLFVLDCKGVNLQFRVATVDVVDLESLGKPVEGDRTADKPVDKGILAKQSTIMFEKAQGSGLKLAGQGAKANSSLFRPDFNFESLGIGGLDKEFGDIFRRAFASRVFPSSVIQKLGIRHVKGILLFGPPGTGKTLMARQIGKMLNGHEPKVVNGPEVLNKYVGQSEENIRALFKDAEIEYRERGDDSDLHIIIFDELDAICKERGGRSQGGTGVGDSIVNQLLAKMDGVEQLNNILIIGMTNRKDMIDEALLRPGRLEVHMEIHLPDEHGRLQILRIHTGGMAKAGYLESDVDIQELAALTKNFSGAEIEGLCKSASSFALNRKIDATRPTEPLNPDSIRVTRSDFLQALSEVKPAFGVSEDTLERCMSNGIIDYGPEFARLLYTGNMFIDQVRNSDRTPLVSVLLEGIIGSGKTAISAKLAMESNFPYVKMITPDDLVGYQESSKCLKITKVFEDAYKSPLSLVIVDDIERLLDYVRIGPRFSNSVLQTLLVLCKKHPPKGRKLLIIGTTSNKTILEDMEFMSCFDATIPLPLVRGDEIKAVLISAGYSGSESLELSRLFRSSIAVKKLLMIAEMAKQGTHGNLVERFQQCLVDYGYGTGL